jgi:uncharacterized protein with FMN-binding domain
MNTLNKILLSSITIMSFGFYAYILRTQDTELLAVASASEKTDTTQIGTPDTSVATTSMDITAYVNRVNAQVQSQPVQKTVVATKSATLSAQAKADAEALRQSQLAAQRYQAQLKAQQQADALAKAQQAQKQTVQQSNGQYKDGTYTGSSVDAFYGFVQVQAVIKNGALVDVKVLQSPNDRGTSIEINARAMPVLVREAIVAQSSHIDGASGASESSSAFVTSLHSALVQAQS